MCSDFADRYGFERHEVNLSNWRTAPFSRWSFGNIREVLPTAEIRAAREQPETAGASPLLDAPFETGLSTATTIRTFLAHAHTDGFVALRRGEFLAEYYAPHSDVNARHIVFSVSKSLTAVMCGILEAEGVIDVERPIGHYLPRALSGAYGDCRLRDLLDMRVSLDFDEAYLNRDGAFARYRRSTLWNPADPATMPETMVDFLVALEKAPDRDHGGRFFYASPNSDMLGLVIEAATGRRFADLLSEKLWQPLGARNHALVSVDSEGSARTAGGIAVTARDLARLGELLRTGGAIAGRQIVPSAWIDDMRHAGDPQAWRAGKPTMLPEGRYRSQWYQTGAPEDAFCAIGIHGQWLYVDPKSETVIVKLSSQPNPLDDEQKQDNFAFFRALCRFNP